MTAALVASPDRVRTPEGAKKYGQPIGTVITKDIIERARRLARAVVPGGGGAAERVKAARAVQPSARDRIRSWFRSPEMSPEAGRILDGFDPRTFQSDQQAGQYAFNAAKPGRFERAPHWSTQDERSIASDSIPGFHEAQTAIREGDTDSPQAKAFIARFNRNSSPTTDDLLVSRRVPVDAFPDGSVEGLAGREIHDAGYFQGILGTPVGDAPVLLTVAVPKGTRAMFPGNGPNDRGVILDRDQRLRVTKVVPDGKGGWYVAAIVVPRSEAPAGKLEEGRAIPGAPPSVRGGGPGAPPLLEREAGQRAPGFAQPRRFDEPETHAVPPSEQRRRLRVQEVEEPSAIRQVRTLPDDVMVELNNPKTTVARMREIAKEHDLKVPGTVIKKIDVRDFLLGKEAEGSKPERRKLSAEAVGQLEDPKTTVVQLRKIAKDHGIKVPGTVTRKADIRAHLMEVGDVKVTVSDTLKPEERDGFREAWAAVGKAPAGPAQRELNEVFIDVRGGRLGLLEGARRLDTSVELDREELGRVRGRDDRRTAQLENEIAAKEKAAKFLREYQGGRSETPIPVKTATVVAKKVAKKAVPTATESESQFEDWQVFDALKSDDPEQWRRVAAKIGIHPRRLESKAARERYAVYYVNAPRPGTSTYELRRQGREGMTGGEIYNALKGDDPEQWRRAAVAIGIHPRMLEVKRTRERYAVYYINEPDAGAGATAPQPTRGAVPKFQLSSDPTVREIEIDNRIRAAYRAVRERGDGGPTGFVGLADLREEIGDDLTRVEVDEGLRRLGSGGYDGPGEPHVQPVVNAKSLTARDRAASFRMGGEDQNAIMFVDPSPRPVPKTAVKKAAPKAGSSPLHDAEADIAAALDAASTEAEGRDILNGAGWSKADFQGLATRVGAEYSSGDSIRKLKDAILRQTVTRRLEHDAYLRRRAGAASESPLPSAPARPSVSQGTPRAVPELNADALEKFNEGQLRVMARHRGIHIPTDATKAEIIDALTSGRSRDHMLSINLRSGYHEGLSDEEYSALSSYMGGGAARNRKLRSDTDLTPAEERSVSLVKKVLGRSRTDRDMTVYRGLRTGTGIFGPRQGRSENLTGFEWTDPAPTSTAATESGALDFAEGPFGGETGIILRIKVPAGTRALSLEGMDESEILLGDGIKYRVVGEGLSLQLYGRAIRTLDVEIIDALTSGRSSPMAGVPGATLAEPVPHSTVQVRPELAQATGHRSLARAAQSEYKRITGRDLTVDLGPDPDLSLDTAREHLEGVLRAAEQWPDVDLREVRWFNGELSTPGQQRPWALGGNGTIMFNTAYTSRAGRQRYLRELEAGVAGWDGGGSGFHPRGANTPAAVAMHEIGHLVAPEREARGYPGVVRLVQRRAREDRTPPSRLVRREVSLYADASPAELVAEAVLDVLLNGDGAGRLSREIVELLRTGRL